MSALLYLSGNSTTDALTPSGVVSAAVTGTAARYATGYAGGTTALLIEEATTNLHVNPSMETNANAYGASTGGQTITRTTTDAVVGSAALSVVYTLVNGGVFLHAGSGSYPITTASPLAIRFAFKGSVQNYRLRATIRNASNVALANTDLTVAGTGAWQEVTQVVTTANGTATNAEVSLADTINAGGSFLLDAVQIESKDHATTYTDGSLGTGYAWTGPAHASTSTRAASTLTIPLSGAWGSVAFRYKESGAWQEGYLTAAGAIGTSGSLAHDGTEFTISTTRQLTIGPFLVFDTTLSSAEQARLFATPEWSLDVLTRSLVRLLGVGLRIGL